MNRTIPSIIILLFLYSYPSVAQPLKRLQEQLNFYDIKAYYENQFKDFKGEKESFTKLNSESPGLEKDNSWLIYKRWENFYAPRVYPSGDMTYEQNMFEQYELSKSSLARPRALTTDEKWTVVGPSVIPEGGDVGRVNATAIDPSNPDNLWLGSPSGGLWKSVENGTTWTTNTDLLQVLGVSEIAIDPANTNVIYIGTGDRDAGDTKSIGILKSTDGGITWNATGLSYAVYDFSSVTRILIHPIQTNIILATTDAGIFKSNDGGATFTQVQSGSFRDMEFKPSETDSILYACTNNNVFISTDLGSTWKNSSSGLGTGNARMAIAVTPANPEYVYALTADSRDYGYKGLYRSVDGGATWSLMSTSPNLLGWDVYGNDYNTGQGWYTLSLGVSPDNANEVYVGGVNIWKSSNGGVTWNCIAHWYGGGGRPYVHADIHELNCTDNGVVYASCDGGIFKSTDRGVSWSDKSSGLAITQFYRLGTSQTNPNIIYAGAQDNGTSEYNNGSWREVYGGDGFETLVDFTNENTAYAEIYYGNMVRTTDGGNSWGDISPDNRGGWVTPYIIDPSDHEHLIYGGSEILQSFDSGSDWMYTTNGLSSGSLYVSLAIAPSEPSTIYAATAHALFQTEDGGETWNSLTSTLPYGLPSITYLAVKSTDENTIYLTCSGATAGQKVFRSVDGGKTWQNISFNLPNIPVNCITYNSNNSYDEIYAGTDMGVYYNNIFLNEWLPVNNGLPNVIVDELEIQNSSGQLRAATFGRGIWETKLISPILIKNDAGITLVSSPSGSICTNSIQPVVTIRNNAADPLNTVEIDYHVDNGDLKTFKYTGNISSLQTQTLTLPAIDGISGGNHKIYVSTNIPNNVADENPENDADSSLFLIVVNETVPYIQSFDVDPDFSASWEIKNPDNQLTWQKAPYGAYGESDSSMMIKFYSYLSGGAHDDLISPKFDLSNFTTTARLTFEVAYASYAASSKDSLMVLASNDCGSTWKQIYANGGLGLAVIANYTSDFKPSPGQWHHEEVDLSPFAGQQIMLDFVGRNGYGNNLYLDDVRITDGVTGISPVAANNTINCYPNPANEIITVEISQQKEITGTIALINMLGESVYEKIISSSNGSLHETIDVSHLKGGMYWVMVKSEDQVWMKKVVVE